MSGITLYSTYENLTPYQRQCLPATNFWRQRNGERLIDVPKSDEHYYRYFNKRMIPADNSIVIRPKLTPIPEFSFFYKPAKNTTNLKRVNLLQIYDAIKGNYFQTETFQARELLKVDRKKYKEYKEQAFHYCCFSGEFKQRKDAALIRHSGLICIDLDHLKDVQLMRERLLSDTTVTTELLFVSPSGDGLKWVVSIDINEASHLQYFFSLQAYVRKTYGLEIDKCQDVSRACFLPHDPNVYINQTWLTATL